MLVPIALALLSATKLEGTIEAWLAKPQVRLVALASIPEKCEGCAKEAPRWSALAKEHRARGLRIIAVVGRDPMFGCVDPGFEADETICDAMYDGIAKALVLPERRSLAFLFSWKGELLVERGDLSSIEREVERQASASLPRIAIDVRGDRKDELAPLLRDALSASNKYRPGSPATEAARIRDLGRFESFYLAARSCEPGEGLNADAILGVRAKVRGLELALRSEAGCALAIVSEQPSVAEAIDALFGAISKRIRIAPLKGPSATPARQLADSRTLLPSLRDPIAKELAKRIEPHLGKTDRTGAELVRAVLLETFGVDVGATLREQLQHGTEVPLDLRDPDATLRPGDLIFYVSYGYVPKVVVLYLGGGLIAEVADIRGVAVGPLPAELPWFFQHVARRPQATSR